MARRRPARRTRRLVGWLSAALLLGAATVALLMDSAYGRADVWGPAMASGHWDAALPGATVRLATRELVLREDDDVVVVTYRLTVPADDPVVAAHLGAPADDGYDFVRALLGTVSVRDGLAAPLPNQPWTGEFAFSDVRLTAADGTATLTARSQPLRLYLPDRTVEVAAPTKPVTVAGADRVVLETGDRLGTVAGADLDRSEPGRYTLTRRPGPVSVVLTAGHNQAVSGLRAIGGQSVPVVGAFLGRLSLLAFPVLMLLVLRSARPVTPVHRTATRIATTLVAALGVVAVCSLVNDLAADDRSTSVYILSTALLLAGALVVWPAHCSGRLRRTADGPPAAGREVAGPIAVLAVVLGFVAVVARYLGDTAGTPPLPVLTVAAALLAVAVDRTARAAGLHRPAGLAAAITAVVLATALWWPHLIYTGFDGRLSPVPRWTYVVVVGTVAVSFGRWLADRVTEARPDRRVAARAVAVGLAVSATVPSALIAASVLRPAYGAVVLVDLYTYLDSLRGVASWVIAAGAVATAATLPWDEPGRRLHRRVLAAVVTFVAVSNWSFLYLPVTVPLMFVLTLRFVLTDHAAPEPGRPRPADPLVQAVAAWRAADRLDPTAGPGPEPAPAPAAGSPRASWSRLRRPAAPDPEEQVLLTTARAREHRRRARELRTAGLERTGLRPSPRDAAVGAVLGAVLGLPMTLLYLRDNLSGVWWGAYPVLNAVDGSLWQVCYWALLGGVVAYARPVLRGRHGLEKAGRLAAVVFASTLWSNLLWNNATGWQQTLLFAVGLAAFLVFLVVALDVVSVVGAGLRWTDYASVRGRRPLVTGAALLVLLGGVTSAVVAGAASELSKAGIAGITGDRGGSPSEGDRSGGPDRP